jgi:hypothetical protein
VSLAATAQFCAHTSFSSGLELTTSAARPLHFSHVCVLRSAVFGYMLARIEVLG